MSTVTVAPDAPGRRVPPAFLGLSVEWTSLNAYAGPARRRRAGLAALLAPVEKAQGAPLALRVGGNSADQAWWNPHGRRRPRTVLQDVTPATMASLAWLDRALGDGPVTLGLNLGLGNAANAAALARAARRHLAPGAIDAVEIGNEPDLFTTAHTFTVGGQVQRRVRKRRSYSTADYRRDVTRYARVLRRGLRPAIPRLVVGSFAGASWWYALPRTLAALRPVRPILGSHLYAVGNCGTRTPPPSWLLRPVSSRGIVHRLDRPFALARRWGLPMRVSELNSAACGGRAGFSDRFDAALWLADTLFALVGKGASRATIHTFNGAHYAPFAIRGSGAQPRPPLAGMLAFARAAPRGSRLVPAGVRGAGGVRAWATVGRGGTTRVLLVSPAAARARVLLRGPARPCAAVWTATGTTRSAEREVCPASGGYAVSLRRRSLTVLSVPGS